MLQQAPMLGVVRYGVALLAVLISGCGLERDRQQLVEDALRAEFAQIVSDPPVGVTVTAVHTGEGDADHAYLNVDFVLRVPPDQRRGADAIRGLPVRPNDTFAGKAAVRVQRTTGGWRAADLRLTAFDRRD